MERIRDLIKDPQGKIVAIHEFINEVIPHHQSTIFITREVITFTDGRVILNKVLYKTQLNPDALSEENY